MQGVTLVTSPARKSAGMARSGCWRNSRPRESPHRFPDGGIAAGHVVVQDHQEFRDDRVALERGEQAAIHIDRGPGVFGGPRKRNPQIGVLGLAGAVHRSEEHTSELQSLAY